MEKKDAPATLIVVDKGMDGSMPFGFILFFQFGTLCNGSRSIWESRGRLGTFIGKIL